MSFYRTVFLSLYCFFFQIYIFANQDLGIVYIDNKKEQNYLELFLQTFFLEDDFSYTLFGEKPMSFSGFMKSSPILTEKIYYLLPTIKHLSHRKAAETFKKYRKYINKDYIFIFNENSTETYIFFIHRNAFLTAIDNNLDVFLNELGENFTPESFLKEILEEKKPLLEIIHRHEGILGILLGYGRHNSLLFQRKADILGRCWGYSQNTKASNNNISLYSTIEELNYLDKKLGFFSEESEYCPLIPIAPLNFCSDNDFPETKKLKEKYTFLRRKINETYANSNPFELILKIMGLN